MERNIFYTAPVAVRKPHLKAPPVRRNDDGDISSGEERMDVDIDMAPEDHPVVSPISANLEGRPVVHLTVGLLDTYRVINASYYKSVEGTDPEKIIRTTLESQQQPLTRPVWDNENDDYIITPNEIFNGSFKLVRKIGQGTFGVVAEAIDLRSEKHRRVALKIVKSRSNFLRHGRAEVETLAKLNDVGCPHVVQIEGCFEYRGHLVIVMELLSVDLYGLIKQSNFEGVSLKLVRKFAVQAVDTLHFLEAMGVVHCDIKPENMLLRSTMSSSIRLVDFGSSTQIGGPFYQYIQSRFYRSPEVIFQLPYSHPVDMWSLGCVMIELYTGQPIFDGRNEEEQVHLMAAVLGAPPSEMIQASPRRDDFFVANVLDDGFRLKPLSTGRIIPDTSLGTILNNHKDKGQEIQSKATTPRSSGAAKQVSLTRTRSNPREKPSSPRQRYLQGDGQSAWDHFLFRDLLRKMLVWDPRERITPKDAACHGFFSSIC